VQKVDISLKDRSKLKELVPNLIGKYEERMKVQVLEWGGVRK